jgi:hypothetical protein
MPNNQERLLMTVLTHQVEELTRAISQVVNTEHIKARIEVTKIIETGLAECQMPAHILISVLKWAGGEE